MWLGKELINRTAGGEESIIDVSSFAAGMYFVIIRDDQATHRMRFIKR